MRKLPVIVALLTLAGCRAVPDPPKTRHLRCTIADRVVLDREVKRYYPADGFMFVLEVDNSQTFVLADLCLEVK